MDFVAAEQWYRIEPEDEMTPESLFEKRWATSLLEHVMQKLKSSFERQDKGRLFELLKPHLISDVERMSYEAIAEELSCSTGTVKSAMHRMKKTYRAIIRSEVAQTVAEGEVEDELQHLMQILSR